MPVIRSSRVVVGDEPRAASIRFEDGLVVSIGDDPPDEDFGDLVIMPGLVDTHVHVNEPGRTSWEGFVTATRAAAAGGTTTIVDMPLNSIPPTVSVEALAEKRSAAHGKLSVDVGFWGGLVPGSEPQLGPLVAAGVCGFKSFLVDSGVPEFPPMSPGRLAAALPTLAGLGVPSLVHAEDPAQLAAIQGDGREYRAYLESRPPDAEAAAVEALAEMSVASGARVHVLHVSSADAVRALARASSSMTGETCPHYLTFCSEEIGPGATPFKCAPPIRGAEHREELWSALRRGDLSMVVSDHSPAPPDIKHLDSGDFGQAWGGIGSLQLRLQATWTGAAERGLGLVEMTEWLCSAPAELAGLGGKGRIEVGGDADFVVWDPDGLVTVRGDRLEHRHSVTPYEGMRLRGKVHATILGGETVYDGAVIHPGSGKMLRRG